MTTLKPKDFIKAVLIDELGTMINGHPYISFIIMGIGIEFLGKCLATTRGDWNEGGHSGPDFEHAIKNIPSLNKYESYLTTHKLYGSFRCGLAHAISPKVQVTLSSKGELGHLIEQGGRINLKVEEFYEDFKQACEYTINMSFASGDKMNLDFLQVPGTGFNSGTNILTGQTSSYSPFAGATTQQGPTGATTHIEFNS
jgi:hypothetical protein